MSIEQRVAQAVRHIGDDVIEPDVDVSAIRALAHARAAQRRVVGATVTAVAVTILILAGIKLAPLDDGTSVTPAVPAASPTSSAAATSEPMDTSAWTTYTSGQYGLTVGYPPGWTVGSAARDWTQADAGKDSPGLERFRSPQGDVYVMVFAIPFDPAKETVADVRAWVHDYCDDEAIESCTGIDDRAVELCVEKRDCHPGLLVPFRTKVDAYFTGGHYNGQLVVVSVWRNDSDDTVKERYGSFQRLLEGFLSTMDVWPTDDARVP